MYSAGFMILFHSISGLFLPAVVRPILDSFEGAKQVSKPALSDVCDFVLYAISLCLLAPIFENEGLFSPDYQCVDFRSLIHFYCVSD
jgi:hypothetical protein